MSIACLTPSRLQGVAAVPGNGREHDRGSRPVAGALHEYFRDLLGGRAGRFLSPPVANTDGWETSVFHFQLRKSTELPAGFRKPLVIRIYSSPQGLPLARHEFAVLRHLHQLGFPVPLPVHLEETDRHFGGPFVLMEKIQGPTFLSQALGHPGRIFHLAAQMADLHARLHRLPVEGFPGPPGNLLPRSLKEISQHISRHELTGLAAGLAWLRAHRPRTSAPSRILHLDYHPLNLLRDPDRRWVVVDWTSADTGDPHADLATTLVLIDCVYPYTFRWWERLEIQVGRPLLREWYLRTYRRRLAVDEGRLRYYQAWAVLRRLSRYGRWLMDGPQVTGAKPELLAHLQPDHIEALCRHFLERTGVAIDFPLNRPEGGEGGSYV